MLVEEQGQVVGFHGWSHCVDDDGDEVGDVWRDVAVGEFEVEVGRELAEQGVSVRREGVNRLLLFFEVEVGERVELLYLVMVCSSWVWCKCFEVRRMW